MFCMKCGKQLPDDARFCFGCGASVGQTVKQDNEQNTVVTTTVRSLPKSDISQRIEDDIAKIDEYYKKASDFYNRGEYDASANQVRQTLEIMVNHLLWRGHVQDAPTTFDGIYMLAHSKYNPDSYIIDEESEKNYHFIRLTGNDGSHSGTTVSEAKCKTALRLLNKEIKKFKNIYVKRNYTDTFIKGKQKYSLIEEIASRGVGVVFILFGICIIVLTLYSISKSNDFYANYNQNAPSNMQKTPNNTIVLIPSIIISIIFILIGLACVIGGPKVYRTLRKLGVIRRWW